MGDSPGTELALAALWLLFIGTHVGLATASVRGALVSRLTERGYLIVFTVVASVTFSLLVAFFATHPVSGVPALGLGAHPVARPILLGISGCGVSLMTAAFAPTGYWDSPAVLMATGVRPAMGLERVTRHPFFAGTVLLMGSHLLLATDMASVIFLGGFVVLAILGPVHQAKKLRAKHGRAYDEYLASTSAIPFLAILQGRQQLALGEQPWALLILGALSAAGIRYVHSNLFIWWGAPVWGAAVAGSVLIALVTFSRTARSNPEG